MYKIIATPVFKLSLQRFSHFIARKYSHKKVAAIKQSIKQKLQQNLSQHPTLAPISSRLLELGISQYRQYTIDDHNIVFYQVDESDKKIILLLIMDSRQDLQKLLYELTVLVQVN